MQIMRHATDVAYELRFYDVPVAYLFCSHGLCVAYMLRCCGKSFLCVTYLYCFSLCLSLVPVFFVLVKIHSKRTRSHCVSSDQAANALHTCCFRSHDVGVTYVWRIEAATNVRGFFLKTGLN